MPRLFIQCPGQDLGVVRTAFDFQRQTLPCQDIGHLARYLQFYRATTRQMKINVVQCR